MASFGRVQMDDEGFCPHAIPGGAGCSECESERTCHLCGAVVGDALLHEVWHDREREAT